MCPLLSDNPSQRPRPVSSLTASTLPSHVNAEECQYCTAGLSMWVCAPSVLGLAGSEMSWSWPSLWQDANATGRFGWRKAVISWQATPAELPPAWKCSWVSWCSGCSLSRRAAAGWAYGTSTIEILACGCGQNAVPLPPGFEGTYTISRWLSRSGMVVCVCEPQRVGTEAR